MQQPDRETLRLALTGFLRERSPLAAMRVLYTRTARLFQIPLPGFRAYVVGGPESVRRVLVTERGKLLWRSPGDPVTRLLRRGVLVVDGAEHDRYRSAMEPALSPGTLAQYVPLILRHVERVSATWRDGQTVDMLVESRRIALLVVMDALFSVDFWEDMPRLWKPILKAIEYISPGAWIVWPKIPRWGYGRYLRELDAYLYKIIRERRGGGQGGGRAVETAATDPKPHLRGVEEKSHLLVPTLPRRNGSNRRSSAHRCTGFPSFLRSAWERLSGNPCRGRSASHDAADDQHPPPSSFLRSAWERLSGRSASSDAADDQHPLVGGSELPGSPRPADGGAAAIALETDRGPHRLGGETLAARCPLPENDSPSPANRPKGRLNPAKAGFWNSSRGFSRPAAEPTAAEPAPHPSPAADRPARRDLLDHLIAAGLDDDQIRDQMLTMLIAGHDTSTALLAWAFYLLGAHPAVMARLEGELEEALRGQPPGAPGGWQPHLLDEVIKETLRLYPPIHLGSRRAAGGEAGDDSGLEFNGQPIPAGERLIYSIYLTHRDPAIWEDADQFKPERFAGGRKQPPFAYVPFGGGPRACVGAAFGQAEARLVIARLLQTHRFRLVQPRVTTHMGATLEPRPGVLMQVQRKTQIEGGEENS